MGASVGYGLAESQLLVGAALHLFSAATPQRAAQLAMDWGSEWLILPGVGHINVAAGHATWEQAFAWLYRLQARIERLARRG